MQTFFMWLFSILLFITSLFVVWCIGTYIIAHSLMYALPYMTAFPDSWQTAGGEDIFALSGILIVIIPLGILAIAEHRENN